MDTPMDTPTTATPTPRITLTLPPVFFADHESRDCVCFSGEPSEYIERRINRKSGSKIVVRLDIADVADLVSDAYHYAGSAGDFGFDFQGVCSSARATLLACAKLGYTVAWMGKFYNHKTNRAAQ